MKLDEIGRFVWRFEVFSFKTNAKQFASSAAKKVHAFKCKMTWTYRSMNGHRKASVVWYKCKKTPFSWPAASQLALNGATWRNTSYGIRVCQFERFPHQPRVVSSEEAKRGGCLWLWMDGCGGPSMQEIFHMDASQSPVPSGQFFPTEAVQVFGSWSGSCLVSWFPWIFRNCETYHTLKSHYIHLLANSKLPLFQWDLAASSFLAAVTVIPFI